MSGLFDSVIINLTSSGQEIVYQPSIGCMVLSFILSNNNNGALPISVWVVRDSTTVKIATNQSVNAGSSFEITNGTKVALKTGDIVYAQCPVANAFSGILTAFKDQ